ncbi:hypothetical protein C8R43DRAFT_599417 [Mycena crocata]|nr:hypothetical protein C8R43DRAFT_599417 [Mycena crocata]
MRFATSLLLLTASVTVYASPIRRAVNCAKVDDDGSALTGSAPGPGDFATCTYAGAGPCTYFAADGSFSSGGSSCPQGLPQDSTFGKETTTQQTQAPPPPPPPRTTTTKKTTSTTQQKTTPRVTTTSTPHPPPKTTSTKAKEITTTAKAPPVHTKAPPPPPPPTTSSSTMSTSSEMSMSSSAAQSSSQMMNPLSFSQGPSVARLAPTSSSARVTGGGATAVGAIGADPSGSPNAAGRLGMGSSGVLAVALALVAGAVGAVLI